MSDQPLITRYRPTALEEVKGQEHIIASLKRTVKDKSHHNYLFSGEPGLGKTTLAMVTARALGCTEVVEHDAAYFNGIDDMRGLVSSISYMPAFGTEGNRAVILNEAHGLTTKAWDSIHVDLENPRKFNYWFFTTTLLTKVPKAIQQRCASYVLRAVDFNTLVQLLDEVCTAEKAKTPNNIVDLCAKVASGSPRQAITNLSKVIGCTKIADAEELLQAPGESTEGVQLARLLIDSHAHWTSLHKVVSGLDPNGIESVRYLVLNYVAKVVVGKGAGQRPDYLLKILRAFSKPFPPGEGLAPLFIAIDDCTGRHA